MRLFHRTRVMQAQKHGESKAEFRNGFRKKPPTNTTTRGSSYTTVPHRYLCLAEIPSYTRQRKENWLTDNKISRRNITSS